MTQHWIYLHTQYKRIQVYNLIKTIDKTRCLRTQQKIPIYMLISMCNTETYTTSERSIVTSDEGGQAHCFGSFSGHAPLPNEINTLFSLLHRLASFIFGSSIWQFEGRLLFFTCSTIDDENMGKWQVEAWKLLHTLQTRYYNRACVASRAHTCRYKKGIFGVIKMFRSLNHPCKTGILYMF